MAAEPSDGRTAVYSFRPRGGMQLSRPWRKRLAGIDRPTAAVIVGARDGPAAVRARRPPVQRGRGGPADVHRAQ